MIGFARFGEKAKRFAPHDFSTKVEMASALPRVFLSRLAYNKMWHYVDIADKEVGWLGAVREEGRDFLIEDVFLLKQQVSASETELSTQGLAEFGQELLSQENGAELCDRIRFWGHSHVNGTTSPSVQDERQMDALRDSGFPYFIRGILNKSGKMEFTIVFYETGVKIVDAEWQLAEEADDALRAGIEAEFKEKVTSHTYAYYPHSEYFTGYPVDRHFGMEEENVCPDGPKKAASPSDDEPDAGLSPNLSMDFGGNGGRKKPDDGFDKIISRYRRPKKNSRR